MTIKAQTENKSVAEPKWHESLPCLVKDIPDGNVYYAYARFSNNYTAVHAILLKKAKEGVIEGMQTTCYTDSPHIVKYSGKLILENE